MTTVYDHEGAGRDFGVKGEERDRRALRQMWNLCACGPFRQGTDGRVAEMG